MVVAGRIKKARRTCRGSWGVLVEGGDGTEQPQGA
jgi:hypothetical protein